MKYLITHKTEIVNQGEAEGWGINKVVPFDNLERNLSNLPLIDEPTIYFIPTILDSNNPLNYDGANLVLRILMYYVRSKRTNVDFVLMGNETERDFLLTFEYPNIMKIPGIHYTRFNKSVVRVYECPQREMLTPEDYLPYFEKLNLKLPLSFKSTHSLTNEWCLYKWNSFMGFGPSADLLEGLYFDYLRTVERLNRVKNKTVSEYLKKRIEDLPTELRLLVIDDNSGWHDFFRNMFSDHPSIDVDCLGTDFRKKKYDDVVEGQIREKIKSFQPDVIMLDFRLMDDEDEKVKDNMKDISGYKVLSKVLKGDYETPCDSFGRQVLIFTATSRIENILLLKEGNADGFILKERPENYNGKEITKDLIAKMISTLKKASDRAKFLIPLNEKLKLITDYICNNSNPIGKDLKSMIENIAKFIRQLTQNNNLEIDILKLVFLNIFNIFEEIKRDPNYVNYSDNFTLIVKGNNELTVSKKSECGMSSSSSDDWNYKPKATPSSSHEKHCKDRSLSFAICALILFRLGCKEVDETEWNTIRLIRNAIAHGNSEKLNNKGIVLNIHSLQDYTLKMLDLINTIIDKKNIHEVTPQIKFNS